MDYLVLQITVLVGLALVAVAYVLGRKLGFSITDEEMMALREDSKRLDDSLVEVLSDADKFVSKGQLEHLSQQSDEFRQVVEQQRTLLQGLVTRLEKTRYDVERREAEQQELRALRDEDQVAIAQALASYNESSAESVSLEQKLAESLKSLDAMSGEIKLTADQQAMFQELSNALTSASAQLRDVIVDYQTAHERLAGLKERFEDLEREYTKLVEQQLGG